MDGTNESFVRYFVSSIQVVVVPRPVVAAVSGVEWSAWVGWVGELREVILLCFVVVRSGQAWSGSALFNRLFFFHFFFFFFFLFCFQPQRPLSPHPSPPYPYSPWLLPFSAEPLGKFSSSFDPPWINCVQGLPVSGTITYNHAMILLVDPNIQHQHQPHLANNTNKDTQERRLSYSIPLSIHLLHGRC